MRCVSKSHTEDRTLTASAESSSPTIQTGPIRCWGTQHTHSRPRRIQTHGIIVTHYPAVLGTDAAGTVEGFAEGVTGFTVGDRVFTQGSLNKTHAAYQQYSLAAADVTAKIPENISFNDAASLSVGVVTATLGLFNQDDPVNSAALFPPWKEGGRGKYAGKPVVIFGGSTSVGQYVIQFAKLAGFSPIIATASLHNTELLKSYGATHVLDRRLSASDLITAVSHITSAPIQIVYDSVSLQDTQNVAYDVLAPGGTMVVVLDESVDPSKKTPEKKIVNVFGNTHVPQNHKTSVSLYSQLTSLLEKGLIRPNRVEVLPDGLTGIPDGLERIKNNQVSAVKLIARPQETA
ncbi:Zinc-type alcohol dehydrogenase-like protein [Sparassis crispa]|uniref:Zinc-type alcohol dehydrogenase-like protein n=1 Tax=Sparassis crispa TaxID=139825 RepID=A0A401H0Z1_9APHY|nr:Zinc-type alcohol dehydrogenase-like protein [Sparassis crispa]GBE88096.1 Zinc-type alcohol dehydrogenase-like protein [Sparassis crispa]